MIASGSRGFAVPATIIAIVAAVLFVSGVWIGEENRPGQGISWLLVHGGLPGVFGAIAAAITSFVLSALLLARNCSPRRPKLLASIATITFCIVSATGIVVGERSMSRAIHQCFEREEEVRSALERYRENHGRYPQSLDELQVVPLPGQRLLRRSVLGYRQTPSGYSMWVADPIMISEATESHAFISEK